MMVFRDFRSPDEVVTKKLHHHVKRIIFPVLLRYRTPKSEPGARKYRTKSIVDIIGIIISTLDRYRAYPFKGVGCVLNKNQHIPRIMLVSAATGE